MKSKHRWLCWLCLEIWGKAELNRKVVTVGVRMQHLHSVSSPLIDKPVPFCQGLICHRTFLLLSNPCCIRPRVFLEAYTCLPAVMKCCNLPFLSHWLPQPTLPTSGEVSSSFNIPPEIFRAPAELNVYIWSAVTITRLKQFAQVLIMLTPRRDTLLWIVPFKGGVSANIQDQRQEYC